nr:MAG TPA: hypothetical protein [Caudoviricetes sp.]
MSFSHRVGAVESPQLFISDSGVGLRTQKREFKRGICPEQTNLWRKTI